MRLLVTLLTSFMLLLLCDGNELGFRREQESVMVTYMDEWTPWNEYNALYSLFVKLNVSSVFTNWFPRGLRNYKRDDYCSFTGVSCDEDRRVIALDLRNQGLVGVIPEDVSNFLSLRKLRLSKNKIDGPLPNLQDMTNLRLLDLSRNFLGGEISDQFPSSLTHLTLSRNSLEGTLPSTICELTDLAVLELTANTKIYGQLPNCLADLRLLVKLRITGMALTGTIPTGLCGRSEMNGLSPEPNSCDAIGCPAGYFQQARGRQRNNETLCKLCRVPSNVIASTRCTWIHNEEQGNDSQSITSEPSPAPTVSPSTMPSSMPSTAPTSGPTLLQSASPSSEPSNIQELPGRKDPPTAHPTAHPTTPYPTTSPSPSRSPSSSYVGGIVEDPPTSSAPRQDGIIASSVVGSALGLGWVACFIIFFFVRKRRRKEASESLAADGLCLDNDAHELNESPPPPPPPPPHREAAAHENDKGGTDNLHAQATPVDRKASTIRRPSLLRNREGSRRLARSVRRVRFKLPENPLSWSSAESGEETDNEEVEGCSSGMHTLGPESWASWIANPLFDGLCAPPKYAKQDDDAGSAVSLPMFSTSSPCNPVSPLYAQDSETPSLHYCLETASRQQDSLHPQPPSAVLGIRGREESLGINRSTREDLAAQRKLVKSLDTWKHQSQLATSSLVDEGKRLQRESNYSTTGLAEI